MGVASITYVGWSVSWSSTSKGAVWQFNGVIPVLGIYSKEIAVKGI